jgi:hypothetical protein
MMTNERISDIDKIIAESHGAFASVWSYTVSLRELTIRITWRGSADNVHIVCNACDRMEMPSAWADVDFSLESQDNRYVLRDRRTGFAVYCGMIRILRNVEPVFLKQ